MAYRRACDRGAFLHLSVCSDACRGPIHMTMDTAGEGVWMRVSWKVVYMGIPSQVSLASIR